MSVVSSANSRLKTPVLSSRLAVTQSLLSITVTAKVIDQLSHRFFKVELVTFLLTNQLIIAGSNTTGAVEF